MSDVALHFACPRCERRVDERFYGPCGPCRANLVESFGPAAAVRGAEVVEARFEPAMHVVPNHVATKE